MVLDDDAWVIYFLCLLLLVLASDTPKKRGFSRYATGIFFPNKSTSRTLELSFKQSNSWVSNQLQQFNFKNDKLSFKFQSELKPESINVRKLERSKIYNQNFQLIKVNFEKKPDSSKVLRDELLNLMRNYASVFIYYAMCRSNLRRATQIIKLYHYRATIIKETIQLIFKS